jgi:hypothetical protein
MLHLRFVWLSGIATVLTTRAFLEATGYPKLGGGGLHIAHVLWGGLMMLAGLVSALAVVGQGAQCCAAVVGGIGFGLFIDEVGKFVTEHTNYFYRPAIGIIYVAFVVLVLVIEMMGRRPPSRSVAKAVRLALVGVTSGLTAHQHATALRLVEGSERETDIAVAQLLATIPPRKTKWYERWREAAAWIGALLTPAGRSRLVAVSVMCVVLLPLLTLIGASGEALSGDLLRNDEVGASLAAAASAVVSLLLGLRAVSLLRRDRAAAFRLLNLSLLANLLVGQVFTLVVNQFAAVTALALNLLLLAVVRAEFGRVRTGVRSAGSVGGANSN